MELKKRVGDEREKKKKRGEGRIPIERKKGMEIENLSGLPRLHISPFFSVCVRIGKKIDKKGDGGERGRRENWPYFAAGNVKVWPTFRSLSFGWPRFTFSLSSEGSFFFFFFPRSSLGALRDVSCLQPCA